MLNKNLLLAKLKESQQGDKICFAARAFIGFAPLVFFKLFCYYRGQYRAIAQLASAHRSGR